MLNLGMVWHGIFQRCLIEHGMPCHASMVCHDIVLLQTLLIIYCKKIRIEFWGDGRVPDASGKVSHRFKKLLKKLE